MKYICLIVLSGMLLNACGKTLSKVELANVLADMYLYEDGLNRDVRPDSVSIYRSVFLKHACTEEEFSQSMKRYASTPKKLKEVYVIVDEQLKARKTMYEAIIAEKLSIQREALHLDSLYRFPADTMARHFRQRCALETVLDF